MNFSSTTLLLGLAVFVPLACGSDDIPYVDPEVSRDAGADADAAVVLPDDLETCDPTKTEPTTRPADSRTTFVFRQAPLGTVVRAGVGVDTATPATFDSQFVQEGGDFYGNTSAPPLGVADLTVPWRSYESIEYTNARAHVDEVLGVATIDPLREMAHVTAVSRGGPALRGLDMTAPADRLTGDEYVAATHPVSALYASIVWRYEADAACHLRNLKTLAGYMDQPGLYVDIRQLALDAAPLVQAYFEKHGAPRVEVVAFATNADLATLSLPTCDPRDFATCAKIAEQGETLLQAFDALSAKIPTEASLDGSEPMPAGWTAGYWELYQAD